MKGCNLAFIAVILLVFASFFGCASREAPPPPPPPPLPEPEPDRLVPLTPYIIYRLGENDRLPEDINKYQFVLSDRIVLEREYSGRVDRIETGGRVRFEDVRSIAYITIPERTDGQGFDLNIIEGEVIVSVGFESDESYNLDFSAMTAEPFSYFYLKYDPFNDASPYGDEKGIVKYGEREYTLRYVGARPYLLIDLYYLDTVLFNPRTVEGRRVN